MAHISGPFRATFTPAELIGEAGKRTDMKLTSGASLAGVKWAVTVTLQDAPGAVLGSESLQEVALLKIPATPQPLVELHRRMARLVGGDHEAVRLETDVMVRGLSVSGKPTKRFRPLFPPTWAFVRSLKRAEIRAPYGSLSTEMAKIATLPAMPRPGRMKLGPSMRLTDEEYRQKQLTANWASDVIRDPVAFRARMDADAAAAGLREDQLGMRPVEAQTSSSEDAG